MPGRMRYQPKRPQMNSRERLLHEAMTINTIDAHTIRAHPSTPANLFPPKTGYQNVQPGISDILQTEQRVPNYRAYMSGVPADFEASSRPSGSGWW